MERNPNKPRLWLDDNNTAGAFFRTVGESRIASDPMNGPAGSAISSITTAEQEGILCTDADVREELLASLEGRPKEKSEKSGKSDPNRK